MATLPGTPTGRLLILASLLLTIPAVLPGPANAGAAIASAPPTLCVVQQDPVAGLEAEALRVAVALEKRRVGAAFNRVDAPSLDDCPIGGRTVVVVVGAGDAWWQGEDGAPRPMDTATMDPRDRASEVARRVVSVLAAPTDETARPIVDGELKPPQAADPRDPGIGRPRTPGRRVEGYVRVGGRYEYQPGVRLHAGSIEFETGVSLLGERLAIGLRGGWQPAQTIHTDRMDARVTSSPVALMIRGGLKWEPVRVRLGVGAGLEWRRVELRPAFTSRRPVDARVFPTLEAELEVAFPFAGFLRAVLAGTVRGFPAWITYAWMARPVLEGPKVGVGLAVRLEAVFGEADP